MCNGLFATGNEAPKSSRVYYPQQMPGCWRDWGGWGRIGGLGKSMEKEKRGGWNLEKINRCMKMWKRKTGAWEIEEEK